MIKALVVTTLLSAAPMVLQDSSGKVDGVFNAAPGDPRQVPVDVATVRALKLYDRRGCHRYRWTGTQLELIPVTERNLEPRGYLAKWREWADFRAAYVATQAYVDARPALKAAIDARIAELRAELDDMTRPGRAEDEP